MNGQRLRERPIGELLGTFAHETTTLLSQEIELARAEIGQEVAKAGKGAGLFGALTACAILALDLVLDAWLAALIVGASLLVVAGLLALAGRSRVRAVAPPVPDRALRSVRQDIDAVQEGVRSGRESDGEVSRHGA
jgi:hypothetical protein